MKEIDKNVILLYRDKFFSAQQIAEKLNLSSSKVRHILEKNGIMWMDDYRGGDGSIKKTMDNFDVTSNRRRRYRIRYDPG